MKIRLPIFALLLLLAGCGRQSDVQLQRMLPGTWTSTTRMGEAEIKSSLIVGPDGAYVSQATYRNSKDGLTQTATVSGTLEVRDGVVTFTITKQGGTNVASPIITTARIVRLDAHELSFQTLSSTAGFYPTNEIVLRKE